MSKPIVLACLAKNKRESVRIALDQWQGHNLIDLRIVVPFAEHAAQLTPTGKGISLQAEMIPELLRALTAAEVKARELGWLS